MFLTSLLIHKCSDLPISLKPGAHALLRINLPVQITTWKDLKTKFLNKYCPPGRIAKKIEEINNFQQEPDETLYQILDSRGAVPTKTVADAKKATKTWQRGGYRATAPGYYQRNNANPSFQERRQSMEETLSKFMNESAKRHEENSNLIKESELRLMLILNQGASINNFRNSIGANEQADSNSIRRIRSTQYAVSTRQNRTLLYKPRQTTVPFPGRLEDHYCEEEGNYGPKFMEAYGASLFNNTIPRKEKDPGSFTLPCFINDFCFDNAIVDLGASVSVMPLSTYLNLGLGEIATLDIKVPLILERPFLSTARAKIDVYKRKITLRVGEEKIVFKSVKPARSIIKRVYMLSLRERMELDLEARLMGETLVLNRSLDPFLEDYIELNDLNEPFKLRRNQGDDLMCPLRKVSVIGALMNVPIFVETFSYVTDFVVLENMDAYHDEVMGDVIFGKPFLREVGIKTRRFEGMITIYNGNDEVTYQMVRSHLRFKHHTIEQCNKIPPLLKLSNDDRKNGISHPYQKLKGFYKGVLNLGPNYIQDARMKEWLTRGHISVHEME
ncbi:hypothetical protein Tco_0129495 [Tanacetum coccineum]